MNNKQGSPWTKLKIVGTLAVIGFAVTLAAVIGNRLSDQALAVLAGAVCGVGAAIPTSLLIIAVTRRQTEQKAPEGTHRDSYPPVVVVAPSQAGQQGAHTWNGLPPSFNQSPQQRSFTVVGDSGRANHRSSRYYS